MIVDERMVAYINSLDMGNTPFLEKIQEEALKDRGADYPPGNAELLKNAAGSLNVRQEFWKWGRQWVFPPFFSVNMQPEGAHVTTIEKYEKRIPIARENFQAGRERRADHASGQEMRQSILKELEGSYDFIFMDAAKGQYIHFLPDVLRLLEPGGVLVSDNVLQDGDLIESRYVVERRNRTIYKRMREYLYELKHDEKTGQHAVHSPGRRSDGEYEDKSRYEYTKKTGTSDSGQQSGSVEDCGGFWR